MGIAEFLGKRAKLSALILAISAAVVSLCLRSPSLQNDDLQIYFMLLNGGEDVASAGYGIYTNYVLGWLLAQVSYLMPFLNAYLLFLFVVSFLSCYCANVYVLERFCCCKCGLLVEKVRVLVSIIVLLLIDIACMSSLQYTHVAIFAAAIGGMLLGLESKKLNVVQILYVLFLVVSAYMLRESALVILAFFLVPFIWKEIKNKYVQVGICVVGVVLIGVSWVHSDAYRANSPWREARDFLQFRVKILDTADNSGIDKRELLEGRGINPDSYKLFRSFVYTPSMDSVDRVSQCLTIHQSGRKGFLGSSILADKGMLDVPMSARFNSGLTLFQRITPWVPLCIMVFLWCVGGDKRHATRVMSLFICLFAYVGVLLLLQRMVGRVLDPALYACAVWMMAQPIAANKWNVRKWVAVFCVAVSVLGCLFFVRHWRISSRETVASEYCAARADTLFLTTCQQGLGLYPIGFCGYSYKWLSQTNILPIADGWNYYSPAYKAALAARGFSSLEEAFFHPRTLIVVREGFLSMTKVLERLADCEWNKKIECSVVDTYGGFHFVKVLVKDRR